MTVSTHEAVWMGVGFAGQLVFTARFLVQWAASEKRRESVVPVAFWWISLFGGLTLLTYAVHRGDPPFILGQGMGLVVYVRNLMLVSKARRRAAKRVARVSASSPHDTPPAPHQPPGREDRAPGVEPTRETGHRTPTADP